MPNERQLKPIDLNYLNELLDKKKPKLIGTKQENGLTIKVYEQREASSFYTDYGVKGFCND